MAASSEPGETVEFSLKIALEKALSEDGQLQYDGATNTFIVKDIKPKLDEISHIIRLVDIEPPLIYVEVKFISTTSTDILENMGRDQNDQALHLTFLALPREEVADDRYR